MSLQEKSNWTQIGQDIDLKRQLMKNFSKTFDIIISCELSNIDRDILLSLLDHKENTRETLMFILLLENSYWTWTFFAHLSVD